MISENKLQILFDFYIKDVVCGGNEYIGYKCPFIFTKFRFTSCDCLCEEAFGTYGCPCDCFGPKKAVERLKELLISEGYIEE